MGRLRVLVADDHPVVLEGLRSLLEPEYEIVGEARDGLALLAAAGLTKPDIIIADIGMPQLDGIEAVRRIRRTDSDVRVVFLTMNADVAYAKAAFDAGGLAFVLKSSAGDELLIAINEAMMGRRFVSAAIGAQALHTQGSRSFGANRDSGR